MADTYSTQWKSPRETGGQWQDVVTRVPHGPAWRALNDLVTRRKHCRVIAHRDGEADYTVDERGPFNGPARAEDTRGLNRK
jgi:hypothetical protein